LHDKQLATKMGTNGYSYVREQFDIGRMTRQYIEVYKRLKRK